MSAHSSPLANSLIVAAGVLIRSGPAVGSACRGGRAGGELLPILASDLENPVAGGFGDLDRYDALARLVRDFEVPGLNLNPAAGYGPVDRFRFVPPFAR